MSRLADYLAGKPWLDLVPATFGAGGSAWLLSHPSSAHFLDQAGAQAHGIFASAGETIAVVGGLGALAVSTYAGGSGPSMTRLRAAHGPELRRNLGWSIVATATSAVLCWIAQIVMTAGSAVVAWSLAVGGVAWCLTTAVRQCWLFVGLTAIADRDSLKVEPPRAAAGATWADSATMAPDPRGGGPRHATAGSGEPLRI